MNYSDKTNYKNIYGHTYWGAFKVEGKLNSNNDKFKKIINNRNSFITDYNIKKCYSTNTPVKLSTLVNYMRNDPKFGSSIDHVEVYLQNDGNYLIVISPYYVSSEDTKNLIDDGWKKIYDLYSNSTTSFVKVIEKKNIGTMIREYKK